MSYRIYAGTQTAVDTWATKVCIYDPGDYIETKKLISPTLTREVSKAGSLEFTVPLGNIAHSALQKLKTVIEVQQDGQQIWQGRVMRHEQDFMLRQKVFCEGELAYLNDSSLAPYTASGVTIKDFFTFLCENHTKQVDAYKSVVCGSVTVGGMYAIPVQYGCKLVMTRDYYEEDPGFVDWHYTDWDLTSEDGTVISADFYTKIQYGFDPDAIKWKLGEEHYMSGIYPGGYVMTRTGDNEFSIRLNAAYSANGKTYTADISTKSSSITSALHSVDFGTRAAYSFEKSQLASGIAIEKQSSTYTVSINGKADAHFVVEPYSELYDFGDGKDYGVTWDILQSELLDKYGGYLRVRHGTDSSGNPCRYLDYLDSITDKNDQAIAFGTNLLDLTSYVKAENIVTRVVAVGKQTTGWFLWTSTNTITATANDTAAQKLFGIIERVIVVDGTSSTLQSLQDAADEELTKNLRYLDGITVKAVDLRDAGIDINRINFGKQTHIYSEPHGVDTWLLCSKLVEPFAAPDKKEFTLGIEFSSISDLQALSARKAGAAYDLSLALKGYATTS